MGARTRARARASRPGSSLCNDWATDKDFPPSPVLSCQQVCCLTPTILGTSQSLIETTELSALLASVAMLLAM